MKILAIGPLWRGSNAGGLFRALSRAGCIVEIIDEFYHVSLRGRSKKAKVVERLIRPMQEAEFNETILAKIELFRPDFLFVYKGVFVRAKTLEYARAQRCKCALFYPDVSMTAHGENIPKAIPLYDIIFTTKTFGVTDMATVYNVHNSRFIPHGFDPEIHRKLDVNRHEFPDLFCDVSFIGTWSPKKERLLTHLKQQMPDVQLKIWGDRWNSVSGEILKSSIQGGPVVGDLYAIAIQATKINLGILSEQVSGASSGDLITSRTFHIPGASGFMLHERNAESVLYYKEDQEAGFFDGPDELTEKVRYYLSNDGVRNTIRLAGHKRALAEHSLDERANTIIAWFKKAL